MTKTLLKTLVGAAVVLAAAIFVYFAYAGSGGRAEADGYNLKAEFRQIGSLSTGADVQIGGIKVGAVTSVELDPSRFVSTVVMSLQPEIEIPTDSAAKIVTYGLFSDSVVSIDIGGEERVLASGDNFKITQDAVNVVDIIGRVIATGIKTEVENAQE